MIDVWWCCRRALTRQEKRFFVENPTKMHGEEQKCRTEMAEPLNGMSDGYWQ
jgi:hypothetical protein